MILNLQNVKVKINYNNKKGLITIYKKLNHCIKKDNACQKYFLTLDNFSKKDIIYKRRKNLIVLD